MRTRPRLDISALRLGFAVRGAGPRAPAPAAPPAAVPPSPAPAPAAPVAAAPAFVLPPRPVPAGASPDRIAAILGSVEAVGRESQAAHLAHRTGVTPAEAVAILSAGHRNPTLSSALGGAVAARAALGLPADAARDAQLARGIESVLGGPSLAAPALPAATEAEEFARGAAAARALLGN